MKRRIEKLYIMQVKNEGIPEDAYHFLEPEERSMLMEVGAVFILKPEYRKKIKVVLSGGVFDILHAGHVVALNEAKKHGDVLVVAVARDENVKKRKPIHNAEYRALMVDFLKPVDAAIVGYDMPEKMLKVVSPDVIVYGYDQEPVLKPEGVEIIKLKKSVNEKKFKTSRIIEELGL